jgi:hypothetical protein
MKNEKDKTDKAEKTDRLAHIEPLSYFLPEFCKKFCVSKSSFYREIHANRLRVYKRGKRTMIKRAEAERWYSSLPHTLQEGIFYHNGPAAP